ncbi:SubName: Full=Uncharacterized protein {ECO:0000313/EMBL:CCA69286.1} [Serendipita indica DSM 11827]|nr:SubName: Full=Uncharacterized protein {ECO:0000313/EMBL:CCA69286.1} [Serendipita indica DSM 11827]
MYTHLADLGNTIELLNAQDRDLAVAHELMRERMRLEQKFINGLRAIIDRHKSWPEERHGEYSEVLITAFEQEIEARSSPKPVVPRHQSMGEELIVGSTLVRKLRDAHSAHEVAYTKLLSSKDELQEWLRPKKLYFENSRMPLIELEYRWSVHRQRECANNLRLWYERKQMPLVESHHSSLEDTKATMIRMINANIDCASTCSRIYSHALGRASSLLPLIHRASIEETMDLELSSHALEPVDYRNWFFDGQPSPLQFGIGAIIIESDNIPTSSYSWVLVHTMLEAERTNDFSGVSAGCVTRFELSQYGPLLPLNSAKFEQLKSTRRISRQDLSALMKPDKTTTLLPVGSLIVEARAISSMLLGESGISKTIVRSANSGNYVIYKDTSN